MSRLIAFVFMCMSACALYLLCLPLWFEIVVAIALLFIALFMRVLCSFVALIGLSAAVAGVSLYLEKVPESATKSYREHEQFAEDQRYQPSVNTVIEQVRGDLLDIDPTAPHDLDEPRRIEFVTDSMGYRNSKEYHGQRTILNGDSFVVGSGITQDETLSELLKARGIDNYSIAFPSDASAYDVRARDFLRKQGSGVSLATFYFEGKDFVNTPLRQQSGFLERYFRTADLYDRLRFTLLAQYAPAITFLPALTAMRQHAERLFIRTSANNVSLYRINGMTIGMYDPHSAVTMADEVRFASPPPAADIVARTRCVFLIPTPYRVYAPYLGREYSSRVPSVHYPLLALQQAYRDSTVRIVDLTPSLQRRASQLMLSQQTVFWRDDTHWNPAGIRAVLEEVIDCVSSGSVGAGS